MKIMRMVILTALCTFLLGCNTVIPPSAPSPGTPLPSAPSPSASPPSTSDNGTPSDVCKILTSTMLADEQGGFVLGGFCDGEWIGHEQAEQYMINEDDYTIIDVNGLEHLELLNRANIQHLDNTIYQDAVKEILEENGLIDTPVVIKQIYSIDLDGDGIDEIIITAENLERLGIFMEKGTYSFMLICHADNDIMKSDVVEIGMLSGQFYLENGKYEDGGPISFELESFIDVKGDDSYQLVVRLADYEHISFYIYDYSKMEYACGNGIGA